jgi:hypothetical protein
MISLNTVIMITTVPSTYVNYTPVWLWLKTSGEKKTVQNSHQSIVMISSLHVKSVKVNGLVKIFTISPMMSYLTMIPTMTDPSIFKITSKPPTSKSYSLCVTKMQTNISILVKCMNVSSFVKTNGDTNTAHKVMVWSIVPTHSNHVKIVKEK